MANTKTKVALYRVVDRELEFQKMISIPSAANYDEWLAHNGYDGTFTIRRGIVRGVTAQERAELSRQHDLLKAQGKLPSAVATILSTMGDAK